jgi:hypothetical protein
MWVASASDVWPPFPPITPRFPPWIPQWRLALPAWTFMYVCTKWVYLESFRIFYHCITLSVFSFLFRFWFLIKIYIFHMISWNLCLCTGLHCISVSEVSKTQSQTLKRLVGRPARIWSRSHGMKRRYSLWTHETHSQSQANSHGYYLSETGILKRYFYRFGAKMKVYQSLMPSHKSEPLLCTCNTYILAYVHTHFLACTLAKWR